RHDPGNARSAADALYRVGGPGLRSGDGQGDDEGPAGAWRPAGAARVRADPPGTEKTPAVRLQVSPRGQTSQSGLDARDHHYPEKTGPPGCAAGGVRLRSGGADRGVHRRPGTHGLDLERPSVADRGDRTEERL